MFCVVFGYIPFSPCLSAVSRTCKTDFRSWKYTYQLQEIDEVHALVYEPTTGEAKMLKVDFGLLEYSWHIHGRLHNLLIIASIIVKFTASELQLL